MMFHRHPCLPIDSELQQSSASGEEPDFEAFMDRMILVREDIRIKACSNIEVAQQKQKYYDSRHSPKVRTSIYWSIYAQYVIPVCVQNCRKYKLELRYWWRIPIRRIEKEESWMISTEDPTSSISPWVKECTY